ncbi:MAG TPA: hypothetical protein PKD64_01895 [Pirellulaceae bacterium]|nr:hypothetical protein [Pirellulaceae bacterium]HMO90923.1 hypothetical protein [Pirellulaceae bacterium]HMP68601.1 hypothetical protein [Pirellulaceae bacterium]
MRIICLPILLIALLYGHVLSPVAAQSDFNKPAVIISIKAIDEQVKDVKNLMNVAGFGFFAPMIDASISEYVRGIDTKKPIGIAVNFPDASRSPVVVAYLPITDFEDVLDTVADFADINEDGPRVELVLDDGTKLYVENRQGFALITNHQDHLEMAANDLSEELVDLPTRFNFAARIYGQRIPAEMRDQAMEMLRQGVEQSIPNSDDIDDAEIQIRAIEEMLTEIDVLVVGLSMDRSRNSIAFDFEISGLPGSKLVEQAKVGVSNTSKFAGFPAQDAAISANGCVTMLPEDAANLKRSIDSSLQSMLDNLAEEMSKRDFEIVEKLIAEFVEVLKSTMDDGIMDVGVIGYMDKERFDIAMGARNSDTSKFESTVRKLVDELQQKANEDGVKMEIQFDESTHRGIVMHRVQVEVPSHEQELKNAIGDTVEIIVGIGQGESYFAVGQNPKSLLIEAIDRSASASGNPGTADVTIAMAPIMEFAQKFVQDGSLDEITEKLRKDQNDKINYRSRFLSNGLSYSFEIQNGIVAAIAGLAGQLGRMGGFGDDF